MARRSSPLSLKARAIALLAQREHSVAELRRKLMRLAELQELQAWVEAHEVPPGPGRPQSAGPAHPAAEAPPTGALLAGRGSAAEGLGVASRPASDGVGSFDLDEDWADGELESFLADWADETGAEAIAEQRRPHVGACPDDDSHQGPAAASLGRTCLDDASGAAASRTAQTRRGRHAPEHPRPAVPGARPPASAAARRPRPAPSAEAWAAVRDDERLQARADAVEQLLLWLQERGYLSEARLVESRINARASRYGNRRIQQELRQLGVAPDEEQQARLKDSELERAREVWRRKFGGEPPLDAASRAKQMRFLAARGFSSDVVRRVLRAEDD